MKFKKFTKHIEKEVKIRLLTQPFQFYCHRHDGFDSDETYRDAMRFREYDVCQLCLFVNNEKLTTRSIANWLIGMRSLDDGERYFINIGTYLYSQIIAYAQSVNWGDPRAYNLVIRQRNVVAEKDDNDATLVNDIELIKFAEKYIDPLGDLLSKTRNEEFNKLYLAIANKKSDVFMRLFKEKIEKDFPHFNKKLKTLLVLS